MIDHGPRPHARLDPTFGEFSRTSKLTDELVLAMRREQPRNLAAWLTRHGSTASVGTARRAMHFKSWTHLPKSGIR